MASWDRDYLTVWTGVQGAFHGTQREIAAALGLPLSKLRVTSKYTGGGYGAKGNIYMVHVIAPILAKTTGRPVKLATTREENYADGGNAPPHTMKYKAGIKKNGKLTAIHYSTINTGGSNSAGGIFLLMRAQQRPFGRHATHRPTLPKKVCWMRWQRKSGWTLFRCG